MARPRKIIDMKEVEKMASEGCTIEEIAANLDVNRSTLYRRKGFRQAYERGMEKCKMSVRRALYKKGVIEGDTKALIFLAKNLLGMNENPEKQEILKIEKQIKQVELQQMKQTDTKNEQTIRVVLDD